MPFFILDVMKRHYNITVKGKVQGVFYRASTKQKADELGIAGFVRNETNSDVYIEAEAEEALLLKFVDWCNKGPENAAVEIVLVSEGTLNSFNQFEVRRD